MPSRANPADDSRGLTALPPLTPPYIRDLRNARLGHAEVVKTASEFGLLDEAEVWELVWPLVAGRAAADAPRPALTLSVHRLRQDGRAVAEYRFGQADGVFVKVYPDVRAGRVVHGVHSALWAHGFDDASPHRVPQPIAYLADRGLLVLGPATGDRLGGVEAARDARSFSNGIAGSARWLAALHASPVRLPRTYSVEQGTARLANRTAKATLLRPDLGELFRSAMAELERRTPAGERPRVPTHGRFHGGHVFVGPNSVTVVDLDQAADGDSARDVAAFIHGLRSIGFRSGVVDDAVAGACGRFLDEYLRGGGEVPESLEYHWSYSVLWTMSGLAFKDRPARRGWRKRLDFFSREFAAVPRNAAELRARSVVVTSG
jgi:hypothetical protein